jgi:4-alpha-glucanotransferase
MFGDNELFIKLCDSVKSYGISVILDGVFSHTGSDSRYFNKNGRYPDRGAWQSTESPYYKWYRFIRHPDNYECWWNVRTLPEVNENEPSYADYMVDSEDSIVKRWLRMGAGGWRIDVADELPDSFIKKIRTAAKKTAPDAVLIGEVWEDASNKASYGEQKEYVFGEEFDSIMNYPLRNAIVQFVSCKLTAEAFNEIVMSLKENYPKEVFLSTMNMLSTHDIARILTVLGDAPEDQSAEHKAEFRLDDENYGRALRRLRQAVLLQMTLPGVPCIYYGDEAGMQSFSDPFNRAPFPWENIDQEIYGWYKWAIDLRKSKEQFISGEFETIYVYRQSCSFARISGGKLMNVTVNTSLTETAFIRLDLTRFEPVRFREIRVEKDNITNSEAPSDKEIPPDGIIIFDLPPSGWRILEIDVKEVRPQD